MTRKHIHPPNFGILGRPNTKRFLIRDIVGNECFDWIADFWSEREPIHFHGFPFRLARKWNLTEVTASIRTLTHVSRPNGSVAFYHWSESQTEILSHEQGHPVALTMLDNLHFDLVQNTWWKTDDPRRVHEVFQALRNPKRESWETLMSQLVHPPLVPQQYLDGFHSKPTTTGLPLEDTSTRSDVDPALIEQIRRECRESQGSLDIRSVLLPVASIVRSRQFNRDAAATANAIAEHAAPSDTPLAHTLLIRPPHEWVARLLQRTKWTKAEILTQVKNLSLALNRAGIWPIADPTAPMVPSETSVPLLAALVGPNLINPEKAWLLTRGGVSTIEDLLTVSPIKLLENAPIMPSDLRGFARALRAVGYQYPYQESDLIQ